MAVDAGEHGLVSAVHTRLSQRAGEILLGGLPPGLGLVMWVMNPEYINQLFVEFLGNVFLGLGIVSSIIGLVWMKKVITIDV